MWKFYARFFKLADCVKHTAEQAFEEYGHQDIDSADPETVIQHNVEICNIPTLLIYVISKVYFDTVENMDEFTRLLLQNCHEEKDKGLLVQEDDKVFKQPSGRPRRKRSSKKPLQQSNSAPVLAKGKRKFAFLT